MDLDIELKILDKRLGTDFPLPDYATSGAAGMDLRAMVEKDTVLNSGETRLIPAGFSMHIADKNVCATIFPRSGLGTKHGIVLGNLTGLIDSDYQGPILVPLWNRSSSPFVIEVGMRIAQMVFLPVIHAKFKVCQEFSQTEERGDKGFGSKKI